MKRLADQTLYEILEVPADAASPAIEAAYDRARTLYGPGSLATYTLMSPEEAALLTSRIEEAKQTLLDPDARKRYDAGLAATAANPEVSGPAPAAPFAQLAAVPPVIPALQPAPAPELPATAPDAPVARAGELLQGAASAGVAEAPAAAPREPDAPTDSARAAAVGAPTPVPVEPRAAAPAPIRLEREIPPVPPPLPEAEIPMPEGSLWTGDALRKVREARGITVQQIADRTKVTRYHVENIEAERFGALPAPVYLRGILLSLARELRLDGQKVARAYLERAGVAPTGQSAGRPSR